MDKNDFYEEDESIEERRAAWKRGEKGVTKGPKDLNKRGKAIVDAVVERWDDADEPVRLTVVASASLSGEPVRVDESVESTLTTERVDYELLIKG